MNSAEQTRKVKSRQSSSIGDKWLALLHGSTDRLLHASFTKLGSPCSTRSNSGFGGSCLRRNSGAAWTQARSGELEDSTSLLYPSSRAFPSSMVD